MPPSRPSRAAAPVPTTFDPLGGSTVRRGWQMTRPAGEPTPGRHESWLFRLAGPVDRHGNVPSGGLVRQ
jgi:hypothetical protein